MSKVIYIAGPMTGYNNFNREAFTRAQLKLSADGWTVLSPAILPDGLTQADYMAIDLAMLQRCGSIYMLSGYQKSKGALAELALAEKLELNIIKQ